VKAPPKKKRSSPFHAFVLIVPVIIGTVFILGVSVHAQITDHTNNKTLPTLKLVTVSDAHKLTSKPVTPHPIVSKAVTPTPVISPVPTSVITPTAAVASNVPVHQSVPVVTPSPVSSVNSLTPTQTPPSTPSAPVPTPSSTPSTSPSTPTPPAAAPTTTTSYTSTNWSGYMASDGSFTGISGSWVAPTPTGTLGKTTADATWIGIGGVTSNDLIQVGTQNTVSVNGTVTTGGFYELLPGVSQVIPNVTVAPGDSLSASLTQTSAGAWLISLTDTTNGETFTDNVTYTSSLSSAEWIEEDPSYSNNRLIPFDNYGSVSFSRGATMENGSDVTMSASVAQEITMVNASNQPISTPSTLNSDGKSFSVIRNNTN
jgi:hypothetical protein